MPRFSAENFPRNMALVRALGAVAREKNASTAQLAFAWIRSRGEDVVPLIGARRRDQLNEALGALEAALTPADLARIAQAVPAEAVAGTRYLPAVLAHMDSEHAGEAGTRTRRLMLSHVASRPTARRCSKNRLRWDASRSIRPPLLAAALTPSESR